MPNRSQIDKSWDRLRRKLDMLTESTDPNVVAKVPDILGDLASAMTDTGIYAMDIAAHFRVTCEPPSIEAREIADAMMAQATITRTMRREVQSQLGHVARAEPQYSEG